MGISTKEEKTGSVELCPQFEKFPSRAASF